MKQLAYRCLSRACRTAGIPASRPAGLRVLLYHSIGALIPGDPYGLSLSPGRFAEHLDRLAALNGEWAAVPFGAPSKDRLEVAVVFDDGFRDTLATAAPLLIARGIPFTVFVTAGFVRDGSPLHLSLEQLRELARAPGAHIGAHGMEHIRLDQAEDPALHGELLESRRFLEDAIGLPVTTLSYPHGAVDRRVAQAAKAAGYRWGGTSRYGLNGADRDPLLLCRTEITAFDTADDLELKLRGHWDWYRFRHRDPAI